MFFSWYYCRPSLVRLLFLPLFAECSALFLLCLGPLLPPRATVQLCYIAVLLLLICFAVVPRGSSQESLTATLRSVSQVLGCPLTCSPSKKIMMRVMKDHGKQLEEFSSRSMQPTARALPVAINKAPSKGKKYLIFHRFFSQYSPSCQQSVFSLRDVLPFLANQSSHCLSLCELLSTHRFKNRRVSIPHSL